jgi:hypothetical protein
MKKVIAALAGALGIVAGAAAVENNSSLAPLTTDSFGYNK